MAAAPDPDEVLSPTSGKDNFHRLTRLLISGGTQLLREVFDIRCPPSNLATKLNNPATENQLRKAKLTKPQWDCLYPSPGTYGESKDFDVTLLFRLLRTICGLVPPATGWDDLPVGTDHSLAADLARIKYYRNSVYGHVQQKMAIRGDEFLQLWEEISQALVRIAGQISPAKKHEWQRAIDNFLHDPLTAEDERIVQELKDWYKADGKLLESVEKGFESIKKSLEELKASEVWVRRKVLCFNYKDDEALLPLTVSCEPLRMAGIGNPSPRQDVLMQLVSQKCLQKIDPSTKELNGFLEYLRDVRQLMFVHDKQGSVIITVGCRSLKILEELWISYSTGRLNEKAQKYLVTKEILNELGLTEVKLTTTIQEAEYRDCRLQFMLYQALEENIDPLRKLRDELKKQFQDWTLIRLHISELHINASERTFLGRSVRNAALVGGMIAIPFTFGMSMVYGNSVAISAVAAVTTGAAGVAVYRGVYEATVGPRGTFMGLIGAPVAAAAVGTYLEYAFSLRSRAVGWKAPFIGAALAMPYTFGMSMIFGKAIATGVTAAVAAVAAGAAGAAVTLGAVAVASTVLAKKATPSAAEVAATATAAAIATNVTEPTSAAVAFGAVLATVALGPNFESTVAAARALGAVAVAGTGAVAAGAVTTATARAVGDVPLGIVAAGAAAGGAVLAAGRVGAAVPESVAAGAIVAIAVAGAGAVAAGTATGEAVALGALATGAVTVGAVVVDAVAGAETGTTAAVALARGAIGAVAGAGAGAVAARSAGATGGGTELDALFVEEEEKALKELKEKVDELKRCVGGLADYCRKQTDHVLLSKTMEGEFPFLRDILLRKRYVCRLLGQAPNNLLVLLLHCKPGSEDSKKILGEILRNEDTAIEDFIKREFERQITANTKKGEQIRHKYLNTPLD